MSKKSERKRLLIEIYRILLNDHTEGLESPDSAEYFIDDLITIEKNINSLLNLDGLQLGTNTIQSRYESKKADI